MAYTLWAFNRPDLTALTRGGTCFFAVGTCSRITEAFGLRGCGRRRIDARRNSAATPVFDTASSPHPWTQGDGEAPARISGNGRLNGFRQGVEAAIPALRRYARALTRDAEIADDLVQDTLVRALRSEHLFHGGDVRSWL